VKTTRRAQVMQAAARLFGTTSRASSAPINPATIRRILWVRLDHIGDVTMSLPSLQALREAFPTHTSTPGASGLARRFLLTQPVQSSTYSLRHATHSHNVAVAPDFFAPYSSSSVCATRITTSRLITWRRHCAASGLVNWNTNPLGAQIVFSTKRLAHPTFFPDDTRCSVADKPRHAVEINCALLKPLRVLDCPSFRFPVTEARRERVQNVLQETRHWVKICGSAPLL
jgi:hypothetical protein